MAWPTANTAVAATTIPASDHNELLADMEAINRFVRKTADESVTSSTTLQNDNELALSIDATGTYVFDLFVIAQSAANSAGDIKIGFTNPTGTLYFVGFGPHNAAASSSENGEWIANFDPTPYGTTTSPGVGIYMHGLLIATATGTLQMRWAQNSSNANATTIKAGSHMRMAQVA